MSTVQQKEKLIDHLKKVGFDDERIEKILSIIPIEEAYKNLLKNEILKRVIDSIGIDEVEKRAKDMGMTIDVFAKKFDHWNDNTAVRVISKATKEEKEELEKKAWVTIERSMNKGLDKDINS